ncbi:protein mono-ADP-ribosyltransferase PARP12-like [Rhopalosiphum padi]|uniref:protein mono-ADP-ribosyltransferase PARP12-like n=1 Tax=Rhopalosiphum padi TaxID=40932 RepID=UPI00298E9FB1|nr:protein mono-ADP-ribosyltransferase PARP12-like [Rhopalosiphum padi]
MQVPRVRRRSAIVGRDGIGGGYMVLLTPAKRARNETRRAPVGPVAAAVVTCSFVVGVTVWFFVRDCDGGSTWLSHGANNFYSAGPRLSISERITKNYPVYQTSPNYMSLDFTHFSQATQLSNIYEKQLLEDYDYEYSNDSFFNKITTHFKILKVQKINNPQIYGMYLLHKEELELDGNSENVKEKTLFHATSIRNAESIARHNIDWRKTNRTRFGIGACFSPCTHYANKYAGSKEAFIIAKVLVKNIKTTGINYSLEIPPTNDCDTTLGNGEYVYVKYDDNTFYPEYIVHYS